MVEGELLMLKKIIAVTMFLFTIFVINIQTFAQNPKARLIDPQIYKFNINDIPKELQDQVLKIRMEPNKFKGKNYDTLLAMGLSPEEISILTVGEASDWINGGKIIYPQYLEKYYSTENLAQELETTFKIHYAEFKKYNFSDEQIEKLYNLGVNPFSYRRYSNKLSEYDFEKAKLDMLDILEKKHNHKRITPYSSNVHCVRGRTFENYIRSHLDLPGVVCEYFASPAFTTEYGYDPAEGTENYNKKHEHIGECLNSVRTCLMGLYGTSNTTGYRYNYYLWAEDDGTGFYHEGVDMNSGTAQTGTVPLYSPITGTIVSVRLPDENINYTELRVFDVVTYKYVNFLHLNIDPYIVSAFQQGNPGTLFDGDIIGTEGNIGADFIHTHVEVNNENKGAQNDKNSSVESSNFYEEFL